MRPEVSIPTALATCAVVYGTYQVALPNLADVRAVDTNNGHLRSAERTALMVSVAVAGGISLIAKDPIPFVLGGLFAVVLSWAHRCANVTDPETGMITPAGDARRYVVETVG